MDIDRLKKEISGRFRVCRDALKMTPPALAAAIGANAQTIRDYEDAKSIPGGAVFAGLCALGINANWVLTGKGNIWLDGSVGMAESATAYGPILDSVLLQEVIEFYGAWLRDNAATVRVDENKHGAVLAVLYKIAAKAGKVERTELEQVLRLAA